MIYFDSTATTKPCNEVIESYLKVINNYWENPSSPYTVGLKANNLFLEAKEQVKNTFNIPNHNVIFTSGATEANNLAIFGICDNYLKEPKKIITTKIEHPSVYNVFLKLKDLGFDVCFLDVDSNGLIDVEQLKKEMNKDTVLVSCMWVNNVIGAIEPIKEVINIVKEYPRCKLHVDAVQGIGKIKNDFNFSDIDLMTISSHKLEGLKGTGILVYKNNINLSNHIVGAGQQDGVKPGTIDLAGAVACAKTVKRAIALQKEHYDYVMELNKYLRNKLNGINGITVNSPNGSVSPFIFNISIREHNAETVMHYLESKEIYVSIGSACGSKTKKPEKTILAITNDDILSTTSIRISLSHHNNKEEIDTLVDALVSYLA